MAYPRERIGGGQGIYFLGPSGCGKRTIRLPADLSVIKICGKHNETLLGGSGNWMNQESQNLFASLL
jgi:ABC-type sugar transport system ATPase subunit